MTSVFAISLSIEQRKGFQIYQIFMLFHWQDYIASLSLTPSLLTFTYYLIYPQHLTLLPLTVALSPTHDPKKCTLSGGVGAFQCNLAAALTNCAEKMPPQEIVDLQTQRVGCGFRTVEDACITTAAMSALSHKRRKEGDAAPSNM